MVQVFQTTWGRRFVRPRLQRNGHTQQKIDEDNALVRLCEATAQACPDITVLVIRSSVHATTYSSVLRQRPVPSAPHITATFRHGPTSDNYNSHILVRNYRTATTTYWPLVERRDVTWGFSGEGPHYPGFEFGVQASYVPRKAVTWSVGDWPALGS